MLSAPQHDESEFRRFVAVSAAAHLGLFVISLIPSLWKGPHLKPQEDSEALNVMWAETVVMPAKTIAHKLPAPDIPSTPPPASDDTPMVLPKGAVTPAPQAPSADEQRRKKLAQALAALGNVNDDRPVPNLNNFPSDQETPTKGLPASPLGGGSSLSAHPSLRGYTQTLQKLITGNFVWFRRDIPLVTHVGFKMQRSGELVQPQVLKSSGDPSFDQAAMRAVLKSTPLPPPPSDVREEIIRETFVIIFDTKKMSL